MPPVKTETDSSPDAKVMAEKLNWFAPGHAPLASGSVISMLDDLERSDATADLMLDEARIFRDLVVAGTKQFEGVLQKMVDNPEYHDAPAVLLCLNQFYKRLGCIAASMTHLSAWAASDHPDAEGAVRSIQRAADKGARPSAPELGGCLDLTPNMRWERAAAQAKGQQVVAFKDEATLIAEGGSQQVGVVEEDAAAKDAGVRKKKRKATGFAKFTFKELQIETDEESKSPSAGETTEEDRSRAFRESKTPSQMMFSFDTIKDAASDPTWGDEKRHEQRFSRIRNRVPTGHPSTMTKRGASKELQELQESLDVGEKLMDDQTVQNTRKNEVVVAVDE